MTKKKYSFQDIYPTHTDSNLIHMYPPYIFWATDRQSSKKERERERGLESRIPLYAGICAKSCQHCKSFCALPPDYLTILSGCGYITTGVEIFIGQFSSNVQTPDLVLKKPMIYQINPTAQPKSVPNYYCLVLLATRMISQPHMGQFG